MCSSVAPLTCLSAHWISGHIYIDIYIYIYIYKHIYIYVCICICIYIFICIYIYTYIYIYVSPSTNSLRHVKTCTSSSSYLCTSFSSFYLYIGLLLYLHLQTVLDILRHIFKGYILLGVLPRSDFFLRNEHSILEFISKTPFSILIKQFVTDFCFYIPGLFMTIFIPLKFGHLFCPISSLIEFRFGEIIMDVQLPLEKIMYHILIPFITEKLQYYTVLNICLEFFFKHTCRYLDLKDILDPFFVVFKGSIHVYIVYVYLYVYIYIYVCNIICIYMCIYIYVYLSWILSL
jgi:hypothetical protein